MARDANFIQQFIADFWDLMPKGDKDLFAAYWHALTMVAADLYQETFEASLSVAVQDVAVYHAQRWNRYQLNSETADLQQKSDSLKLQGVEESFLTEDAVMFDTLEVTKPSGSIKFTESKRLYAESITSLTYGNLVEDTVRVSEGSAIFIANRDYSLNRVDGLISRINTGGIPEETLVTITYMHPAYSESTDYTLDRVKRTIARVVTGNIADGDTVAVNYTYDAKVADKLSGRCEIDWARGTIQDDSNDFTGVLPHRTVEILSGANAGTYTVKEVLAPETLEVNQPFTANDSAVPYTINAFPYAIDADETIRSIPTMQNLIVDKTLLYQENIDYLIGTGKISFKAVPPITREADGPTLWAERTYIDEETVYRNFGKLVDFYRASSSDYLEAIRSLWYAYWTGPTHENLLQGLHVLIGLPYATEPGTVTAIATDETLIQDVSAGADLMPQPVRLMPTHASDAITAPDIMTFAGAITPETSFGTDDVGRKIRIQGSSSGNDGYYTITSVPTASSCEVIPATLSSESSGFSGRLYEDQDPNVFEYSGTWFTPDDAGNTVRISGSGVDNDGDYVIASVINSSSCTVEGQFKAVEGPGTITAKVYDIHDDSITITNENDLTTTFDVPSGLSSLVSVGDTVSTLQRLTTGVRIFDKVNTEDFVEVRLGSPGIQRFLTQNATAADETKAMTLLKEHLWIPQIIDSAASEAINIDEIRTFLTNLKPKWTEYVFAFAGDFEDAVSIREDYDALVRTLLIDLTTRLSNSWPNIHLSTQYQYAGKGDIAFESLRSPTASREIKVHNIFTALDGGSGDFTADDEGRYLVISGSGAGNDGTYAISKVLSSSELQVTPDFTAAEVGGFTASISAYLKLTDAAATFTTDASLDDVIQIESGSNLGFYRIIEVTDDTNLLIKEKALDGPFETSEAGRNFNIVSRSYFQDQGSIDFEDSFVHERDDGQTIDSTTFQVADSINLSALSVRPGYFLVIKSGSNMDRYDITAIPATNQVTISGSFPSTPSSSEDYAICQAALIRTDSVPTTLEVIPI